MTHASVTLRQPSQITFGPGCAVPAACAFVRTTGSRRVFLLTSPSVAQLAATIAAELRSGSVAVDVVTGVPPEPTTACAERILAGARAFAPDLVLAVGGGSVLDVAKIIAALHDRTEPISAFYGINVLVGRRTALVCVPTTAGTGSEVSPNALFLDEVTVAKKAIISPALVPDAALIDPSLMVSLPPALTATTGIDALAHCLETYANLAAHPTVDLHSLEGVRLIGANLTIAVADGSNLTARSAVALGSLYGGLGLGPVNTTGVHALAYPLGGEFHLAHGISIALMLPHVVRHNLSSLPSRHTALAEALGAPSVEELPDRLEQLIAACGIPMGLSAHGIPREALPRIADAGLGVTRLLKNNPREITRADALRIYEAAF